MIVFLGISTSGVCTPAIAGNMSDMFERLMKQKIEAKKTAQEAPTPNVDATVPVVESTNMVDAFEKLMRERINTRIQEQNRDTVVEVSTPETEEIELTPVADKKTGVVTASSLNFRSGIWGDIKGTLSKETSLEILDKKDGWYQVKTADGEIGWVSGRYIRTTDDDETVSSTDGGNATPTGNVSPGTGRKLRVETTGYYPPPSGGYSSRAEERMEGGALDCRGNKLRTLQDYKPGSYVSVATDPRLIRTGTYFTIDEYPGIKFLACDVGGAIKGHHIDICVNNRALSYKVTGHATIRYL
jgi:3D (Asp-Asp-Asp) domain-containing protein